MFRMDTSCDMSPFMPAAMASLPASSETATADRAPPERMKPRRDEAGAIREVEAEEKEMEEVAASEEPTATPVAKKVVESVSKETYFSAEERESLIAELKAQILAELSKEEVSEEKEETTEEVELSKPIQHNPENAQPREQISFNKKEQSLKSMVYDLISK